MTRLSRTSSFLVGLSIITGLVIPSLPMATSYGEGGTPVGNLELWYQTTHQVIDGYVTGSQNGNATDDNDMVFIEEDMYSDTNFSGSTETVTTGTAGGGSFPTALDTDDASRRSYTEANTATSSYTATLVPTSDIETGFDTTYPASPTDHYSKVDEGASHDSDSTYNGGITNADRDEYGMGDLSTPTGSPSFDVTLVVYAKKIAAQGSSINCGIEVGGTEYAGISAWNPANGAYGAREYTWTVDPSDSNEWTYTEINALNTYLYMVDAAPDVYVTSVYLYVYANYTPSYTMDVTITYSSVTNTTSVLAYYLYCQGYRQTTETFTIYAWNYTASSWDSRITVSASSDTDYDVTLYWPEYSSTSSEVKIRIVDTSGGDSAQDTIYLDVLKVKQIRLGYKFESQLTFTGIDAPSYGTWQYQIYCHGDDWEQFRFSQWHQITHIWTPTTSLQGGTEPTWYYPTMTFSYHVESQATLVKFYDYSNYTNDMEQNTFYVDSIWLAKVHYTIDFSGGNAANGADPDTVTAGETIHFFCQVTDTENDLPSAGYPTLNINGVDYTMTQNSSGDLDTWDGKSYYLDKTDIPVGTWDYNFTVTDDYAYPEGDISYYANQSITVNPSGNHEPTMTGHYKTPSPPCYFDVSVTFFVNYTDADNEAPESGPYWREDNGTTQNITMTAVDGDTDYTDGKAYYAIRILARGIHWYDMGASDSHFWNVTEDFSITISNYDPYIQSGPVNQNAYRSVSWSFDFNASDNESDTLSWGRSGADWFTITGGGVLSGTTTDTPGDYPITVYVNDSYSPQGQDTHQFTLSILNRPPVITSDGNTTQIWTTYLSYEVEANDPDGDSMGVEFWSNCSDFALDGWFVNGTAATIGVWSMNVWVNDSYSGSDLESWTLTVAENQAPYFTDTTGDTSAENGTAWAWTPTVIDPDDGPQSLSFTLDSNATWMQINAITGRVNGTPGAPGTYYYNITVSDGDKTSYLNTTLTVSEAGQVDYAGLALTLAFGFGCFVIGAWRRPFWLLSGLSFIFGGIFYLTEIHVGFTIISIGMGFILLLTTAAEYLGQEQSNGRLHH